MFARRVGACVCLAATAFRREQHVCMPPPLFLQRIQLRFGLRKVIDVLADTGLEEHARENDYGIFVIRNVLSSTERGQWEAGLNTMFDAVQTSLGPNSTKVKSKGNVRHHYNTVQANTNGCTCKYHYEDFSHNLLFKLPDDRCNILTVIMDWMRSGFLDEKDGDLFNELVTNSYDPNEQDARAFIPWHSDQSSVIGDRATILSVSTHSPGAFCFAPKKDSELEARWRSMLSSWETVVQKEMRANVRGVLPLFPGDLMGMWGSAQVHLQHKTLRADHITDAHLMRYPAVNSNIRASVRTLLAWISSHEPTKRGVVTFRKIVNHVQGSMRCPCVPAVNGTQQQLPPPRPTNQPALPPARPPITFPEFLTPLQEEDDDDTYTPTVVPSESAADDPNMVDEEPTTAMDDEAPRSPIPTPATVLVKPSPVTIPVDPSPVTIPVDTEDQPSPEEDPKEQISHRAVVDWTQMIGQYVDQALPFYLASVADPMVFVQYIHDLTHNVDRLVQTATEETTQLLFALIDKLSDARDKALQRVVTNKIINDARSRLETLRRDNYGNANQCFKEESTPGPGDMRWKYGTNSANKSRTYRVLAPMSYVLDVFKKADPVWFREQCGISCLRADLEQPDTKLYHLKQPAPKELLWEHIGSYIEIKILELDLNYVTSMHRYQFLQLKKERAQITQQERNERTRAYLNRWASILESTKRMQMQMEGMVQWPPLSYRPWRITSFEEMPVVIWLRKRT